MRIDAISINVEEGDHITNEDGWKMETLIAFVGWLVNERGVSLNIAGNEPNGDALGALIKDYVMHGPYSDEALVRQMQAKGR